MCDKEEKRNTKHTVLRRFNVGAKSCAHGNEKFKEKHDLYWGKRGSGTRPHPAQLPTCKMKLKMSLCNRENYQRKAYANVSHGGGPCLSITLYAVINI